jgi:hypothetical protein
MIDKKVLLLALAGMVALPAPGGAQGFNGRARTYASALQIRNLVLDSVPQSEVNGHGPQRVLADGTPAVCGDAYCSFYRAGTDLGVIPVLQDVELNLWPGITGLRAYAHLRARQTVGEWKAVWPGMDEQIEALAAYVEYRRSFYRVQAGRMWRTSALGFYNYDGGSAELRLPSRLDLTLYGGLSLVRGTGDARHSELVSPVEPLGPREDAYLGGIEARWRPIPALSASLVYQREEATRSGDLYSERMAGSARYLWRDATVDMELKYDLATEEVNLARLGISGPIGMGFRASGELRKYTPFFELWTIWGAFSPVGYQEARARLDWASPGGSLSGYGYGAYRQYGETRVDALGEGPGIRDDGWRLGAGGRYALTADLTLSGEYRYDEGYGSSRHGGDLSLQRFFARDLYVSLTGTAFETFSELQIGSGRVFGGGIQGGVPIGPAKLMGGAMFYKHRPIERPSRLDLNQSRLNLVLEIPFGKEPGLKGGGN